MDISKKLYENIQSNLNEDDYDSALEEIKEQIKDNEDLRNIVSTINSYDGSFQELDYWENGEDFFQTFYQNNIDEAVRAVCFGDYNYTDEYVRIDVYGNLESTNDVESEIIGYLDEIVDHIVENWSEFRDDLSLSDETKAMIDKYVGNDLEVSDTEEEE